MSYSEEMKLMATPFVKCLPALPTLCIYYSLSVVSPPLSRLGISKLMTKLTLGKSIPLPNKSVETKILLYYYLNLL